MATSPFGESPQSSSWKGDGGCPLSQQPSKPPEASQRPQRSHQGLQSFPRNPVGHVLSKILLTPTQSATLERERSHFITLPVSSFPKIHPHLFDFETQRPNKYSNIPQQTEQRSFNMHHRTKTDLKADPLCPRGVGVRFQFIQPLAGFAQESRNIYFHALAYSVELFYCILK